MFKILKDIVGGCENLEWNLATITMDFEQSLLNSFSKIFDKTHIVDCLFHFKQALYREAQIQGLTKDDLKEETQSVISLLGDLSWKGNLKKVEKELSKI